TGALRLLFALATIVLVLFGGGAPEAIQLPVAAAAPIVVRLSSRNPNLQNIPIRTPLGRRIRRAFVAGGADLVLLAADYSQIELRVLAHMSGDPALTAAFREGADVHRRTAAAGFNVTEEQVTREQRDVAK